MYNNSPRKTSTTGVKYLNIHYRKHYKCENDITYNVRITIDYEHFVIWKGENFYIGEEIAKRVQELMSISKETFIEWYKNESKFWIENLEEKYKNVYKNENNKS